MDTPGFNNFLQQLLGIPQQSPNQIPGPPLPAATLPMEAPAPAQPNAQSTIDQILKYDPPRRMYEPSTSPIGSLFGIHNQAPAGDQLDNIINSPIARLVSRFARSVGAANAGAQSQANYVSSLNAQGALPQRPPHQMQQGGISPNALAAIMKVLESNSMNQEKGQTAMTLLANKQAGAAASPYTQAKIANLDARTSQVAPQAESQIGKRTADIEMNKSKETRLQESSNAKAKLDQIRIETEQAKLIPDYDKKLASILALETKLAAVPVTDDNREYLQSAINDVAKEKRTLLEGRIMSKRKGNQGAPAGTGYKIIGERP